MSASLTTQQLTELLHTAADLESAIYTLNRTIPETKEQIKARTPKKPTVRKAPPAKEPKAPDKPICPQKPDISGFPIQLKAICACMAGVFLLLGLASGFSGFGGILSIIGLGCMAALVATTTSNRKKAQKSALAAYQSALDQYQREEESYPRRLEQYQQDLAVWQKRSKTVQLNYETRLAESEKAYELTLTDYQSKSRQLLRPMEKLLRESRRNLEKLYASDWLYLKYRSLPAVTTIYEYFLSGRCTELTGPDGAYNLYESELRQNIIIEKLENIEKKLDQIQQNQFLLYTEMQRANQISQEIAQDTKAILSQTKEIAWNTKCTAYFSEVTAKNTEAIKILTFLNGAS